MPRPKKPTINFCPNKGQIEALTPIIFVFFGFVFGITCVLTDNVDSGAMTLATAAVSGGAGLAVNNAKDDNEIEAELELQKLRNESMLGNYELTNREDKF